MPLVQLRPVGRTYWAHTGRRPALLAALQHALHGLGLAGALAAVDRGCANLAVQVEWPALAQILVSADPVLLLAELGAFAALAMGSARLLGQLGAAQPFYDDLVTLCKQRNISVAEVLGVLTLTLGFIVFDAVLALSEDDLFDNVGYVLLAVMAVAIALTVLGVDVQYFFMSSGASSGETTARLIYGDVLHNVLCLTRILFCWIRYLFYDLQGELVDVAFHFAETADASASPNSALLGSDSAVASQGLLWGTLSVLGLQVLAVGVDLAFLAFQTVLAGLKLMLALYLFWLMLDLLVLRSLAHAESTGLLAPRATPGRRSLSLRTRLRRKLRRAARCRPRYIR